MRRLWHSSKDADKAAAEFFTKRKFVFSVELSANATGIRSPGNHLQVKIQNAAEYIFGLGNARACLLKTHQDGIFRNKVNNFWLWLQIQMPQRPVAGIWVRTSKWMAILPSVSQCRHAPSGILNFVCFYLSAGSVHIWTLKPKPYFVKTHFGREFFLLMSSISMAVNWQRRLVAGAGHFCGTLGNHQCFMDAIQRQQNFSPNFARRIFLWRVVFAFVLIRFPMNFIEPEIVKKKPQISLIRYVNILGVTKKIIIS